MDALANASALKELLAGRCDAVGHTDWKAYLGPREPVPSALSFVLLHRPDLQDVIVDSSAALTGLPGHSLVVDDSATPFRIATALHPAVLTAFALEGQSIAPVGPKRASHLRTAIADLDRMCESPGGAEDDYRGLAGEWISMVVWLRVVTKESSALSFSSAAFPELSGCIFVTDFALHHLPPDTIFRRPCRYALLESLVHEALHHRLGAALALRPIFRPGRRDDGELPISVPWREARWSYEHALHALYVYRHVIRLRSKALTALELEDSVAREIEDSIGSAQRCSDVLARELLGEAGTYLDSTGRAVLDCVLST